MEVTAALPLPNDSISFPPASRALQRLLRLKPVFAIHGARSEWRPALEAYVGQQFERAYGAKISEFLPDLISMQCNDHFSAVAGIRAARDGRLFVEQYIDDPIEQRLSRVTGTPVRRSAVVEIGNLSATHRGATLLFFVLQAAVLHAAGYEWAVFCATGQVGKITSKLNIAMHELAAADPARLGPAADSWGRYYDTRPTVIAADVQATYDSLIRSPLPAAAIAFFGETITELARSLKARSGQ